MIALNQQNNKPLKALKCVPNIQDVHYLHSSPRQDLIILSPKQTSSASANTPVK